MREKAIEEYLRDRIKSIGGRAYKFVSPGNNGVPDRMICLPGGEIIFVELKSPGKKSTSLQKLQQKRLRDMGFLVYDEVDSKEKVDEIFEYCRELAVVPM